MAWRRKVFQGYEWRIGNSSCSAQAQSAMVLPRIEGSLGGVEPSKTWGLPPVVVFFFVFFFVLFCFF